MIDPFDPQKGLTPGRIVHYVAFGTPGLEYQPGAHRAAIVTLVSPATLDGLASICVFNPTGLHFIQNCAYQDPEENQPGTWHWPEHV